MGAMGAMQQANATAAAAEYNAEVDKRNRAIVLQQTDSEIVDKQNENRRNLAKIRTAYAGSGFTLEGSPLAVLEDTALEQNFDVEKIRYRGQVKALGYSDQETLHKMEAKSARKAGYISAAGSLFAGATQAGTTLWQSGALQSG
jgi:hypothetical protein